MKKMSTALVAAFALTLAPAALGHTQTVRPAGQEDPVLLNDPISRPFAQAHCHAQAPAVVADASGGVVSFSPAGPLPCPAVLNPGGQVTGP